MHRAAWRLRLPLRHLAAAARSGAGIPNSRAFSADSPSAHSSITIASSASSAPKPSVQQELQIQPRAGQESRRVTAVFELSVTRDPRRRARGSIPGRSDVQIVNGRPAAENQQARLHRSEDRDAGTDGVSAGGQSAAVSIFLARRCRQELAAPPRTHAIDFIETPPERVRIKWEGNCFEAEGGGHQGRVWFDPISYDVMQVVVRLSKPFVVPMPSGYFGLEPAIRVERSEMTLRFARVEFQQPDESVLLPQSIDTLTCLARRRQSENQPDARASYRRFLTKTEIRPSAF